jgi:proton-dependent oligopeptide transporter, POT family
MYGSLAIVGFVAGTVFFLCFRKGRKWSANAMILEAVQVESNNQQPTEQVGKSDVGKAA